MIFRPIDNRWCAGCIRNRETILCNNRSGGFQRFRFALRIDSLHAELVAMARYQTFHRELRKRSIGFASIHPDTIVRIELLNHVVINRYPTIIFRFLPFKLAAILGHVLNLKRSLRCGRLGSHCDSNLY
uniref:Uncharacterized protein n=1 Tax=Anopheles christyi TaxID=43041 RepID=A0A182KHR0_9DIPT